MKRMSYILAGLLTVFVLMTGSWEMLALIPFAIVTRSQIPEEVSQFYDRLLLTRALPLNIHGLFGQRRNIPSKSGSADIGFRRYGSLSAATTPLTAGTVPGGSALSVTDIAATVSQYGDFVEIADVVEDQSIDPVLTETSEILGEQMGLTNDQLTRDILAAGTNIIYASSATSRITVATGMNLSATEVKKAVRNLSLNNARVITSISGVSPGSGTVPINAAYIGIVSPNTAYDVKSIAGFESVEKYAVNTPVLPGEVGRVDKVRFCETTNAKVFTGAGAGGIDVHATVVLAANAYGVVDLGNSQSTGMIFKGLGSAGSADPLNQKQTAGWKEYFTAKILNDNFMVRIEHSVTA